MTPGFEPFLAAVIAAPDDDLPRRIAADWLDERGEPERAEFIRLQIDLIHNRCANPRQRPGHSKQTHPCKTCAACRARESLRRREKTFLAHHVWRWGAEAFGQPAAKLIGAVSRPQWRRGFIASVKFSWDVWQRHADAILAACPIRNAKDGVVRLTTWPAESFDQRFPERATADWTLRYLAARFPGVRFELPPPSVSWATTAHTTPLADFRRVMRAMEELGSDVVVSPRVLDADFS